jgi:hypothetical protein
MSFIFKKNTFSVNKISNLKYVNIYFFKVINHLNFKGHFFFIIVIYTRF